MKLLQNLAKILPHETAYAHCDVPCGIYDPKAAQTAAATVLKMVTKLKELPALPSGHTDINNFIRMVTTKEEHAQKCKTELLILWTDYFKAEHLEKFPDLHTIFWMAAKLCSKNKQEVSIENAQALVKAVDEIADIFSQTKKA